MAVEALGRLAALLLRLLTTSHSETLVFVFHIFSKTSFRQTFHALGRFFLSQNISQRSSAVYENKAEGKQSIGFQG